MNKRKKQYRLLGGVLAVCLICGGCGSAGYSDKEDVSDQASDYVNEDSMTLEAGAVSVEDVLTKAKDYREVYDALAAYHEGIYAAEDLWGLQDEYLSGEEEIVEDPEQDMAGTSSVSFTGIPEHEPAAGAVCKVDGEYVYLIRNDKTLQIMKLDGSDMEHAGLLSQFTYEGEYVQDMYVQDDVLVLITGFSGASDARPDVLVDETMIYTYDISEKMYPTVLGSVELEGYYMGSRMTDHGFYVYTNCYKYGFMDENGSLLPAESLDPAQYVPMVNGKAIEAEHIYMSKYVSDISYITCAAIDLTAPQEVKEAKAFLSADQHYYGGEHGIYFTLQNGLKGASDTAIIHVALSDTSVVPDRAGAVEGAVIGTHNMSEKDGFLRVLVMEKDEKTTGTTKNTLYVFDGQFKIVGKKEDMAEGQTIQATKYIEDTLYLVTVEDSMITVDLSDPQKLEETKAERPEGFEGHLSVYKENQLLGISYVTDPDTLIYDGIRLAMFDRTKASEVLAEHSLAIQADTSPAVGEADGVFVDAENGLIGFSTEDWDESYTNVDNYYRLYEYSVENGFEMVLEERLGYGSCWYARGFVSGDTFYLAEQDTGTIRSYDMANGYAQTGEMYY